MQRPGSTLATPRWSPSSRNPLSAAAYHVLSSGEPELSFNPEGGRADVAEDAQLLSLVPLQEKSGRTFGVLVSSVRATNNPLGTHEWLLQMAKLAGQMLEMVWRREQLETLIKVAQASLLTHTAA